jgi:glycosyl transferase family 1
MSDKNLHIVSFDNPYPPNYGGVIDVFYKIKALHQIGYSIHLHCFVKEVPEEYEVLKSISAEVYFYKISQSPLYFFSKLPFSVISRNDSKLAENISRIKAPVLFEGLKTTCLVHDYRLKDYVKILRLQNIEEDYFNGISKSEESFLKKVLFKIEAWKYQKYKDVFSKFNSVISLSKFENEIMTEYCENPIYIPVFHGNEKVVPLDGFGDYAIYHGDLNTSDNRKCVAFLIDAFRKIPEYKLIIASGSNEELVKRQIGDAQNIQFVKLQGFSHLKELLQKSHISISWSFQKSGTKLKAINSLFNTRFCIINENIIDDDVVSELCTLVNNQEELTAQIKILFQESFSDYTRRSAILENYMSDINNAFQIEKLIQDE